MRFRYVFIGILCLSCLFNTTHIVEGSESEQLTIDLPYLDSERSTTWRPQVGDTLTFTIQVTKPSHYSGGKLTATLSDTTSYFGECGNRLGSIELYDLVLPQDLLNNQRWNVETTWISLSHPISPDNDGDGDVETMYLHVDCKDYAAYSKLTFATTESSTREADPVTIKIPKDGTDTLDDGNKIADCWKGDEANPYDPNIDNDPGPNTQFGDGLAVLDEYRGLYVNGSWTDTDPSEWDVFIWSESGIGNASALRNMQLRSMSSAEVDYENGLVHDFKIVHTPPHGMVYAIRLRNDPTQYDRQHPQEPLGHMGLGPPSSGTRGNIFTDRIREYAIINGNGQTAATLTDAVVAHEIGHGVHLRHCPDHIDLNCYMWQFGDRESHNVTAYGNHHKVDYDLKSPTFAPQQPLAVPENHVRTYDPNTGTWTLSASVDDVVQLPGITVTPSNNNVPGGNSHLTPYGCHNIAENDWCSDDGTCTTRSDASSDGPCGHRWCLCANYNGSETSDDTSNNGDDSSTSEDTSSNTIISTNTGFSSNGCDYNAEYDYCSDTGSCTTTSDPYSNGSCGHRHCLCANHNDSIISTNTGPSENGCDYNAERDYCTDAGSCATTSDPSSNGPCGHRYCLCAQ